MTLLQQSTTLGVTSVAARTTLILSIGWCGTLLLRKAPAAVRHLVWLTAIVGALLALAVARVAPVRVALLPASSVIQAVTVPSADVSPALPLNASHADLEADGARGTAIALPSPAASAMSHRSPPASGRDYLRLAVAVWLSIAAALIGWLVVGMLSMRRILRDAETLDAADWTGALTEAAARLDLGGIPRLVLSDRVAMAFACGAPGPAIVLPAEAESWADDRRRVVLLHEVAHLRRHDLTAHTIARVACAVYWFHPLMWRAARGLRAESERACDELVLNSGIRASDYAQHLLDMVAGLGHYRAPASALPMARGNDFEGRLLAILDRAHRRTTIGRARLGGLAGVFGLITVSIAAVAPVRRTNVVPTSAPLTNPVSAVTARVVRAAPPIVAFDTGKAGHPAQQGVPDSSWLRLIELAINEANDAGNLPPSDTAAIRIADDSTLFLVREARRTSTTNPYLGLMLAEIDERKGDTRAAVADFREALDQATRAEAYDPDYEGLRRDLQSARHVGSRCGIRGTGFHRRDALPADSK